MFARKLLLRLIRESLCIQKDLFSFNSRKLELGAMMNEVLKLVLLSSYVVFMTLLILSPIGKFLEQ